ncbi:hypothetical protein ScPMuIL_006176 [Solemya velum]
MNNPMQSKEEKVLESSIEKLIQRVQDMKNSLGSFIMKLETEYTSMTWPTVLDNFALLSGQLNTLGRLLKGDGMPTLRNHILLPLALNPDRDPEIEKLTEGRVVAFNHDVVPDYLRTKPEPEVEERSQQLITKAVTVMADNAQKQLTVLNKITSNILDIINSHKDDWESECNKNSQQQQTSSMNETTSLLQATLFGKGLKQPRRQEPVTTQQPPTSMQNQTQKIQGGAGKVQSTVKTNIKSGSTMHPYQRP